MKYFVVFVFAACAAAERLENTYLPPNSAQSAGGSGNFLHTPFKATPAAQAQLYNAPNRGAAGYSGPTAAPIAILRLNNDNNGDGTYNFDFETENHISQQESGQLRNAGGEEAVVAQGSYSFTAPDGQIYTVNYVADENGFQPQGAHIPTAPPVPAEILKMKNNKGDKKKKKKTNINEKERRRMRIR
ncbi:hypothetical protein NQ314_011874 [Rhamnusium bicolor]|uniref:Uncharacterized protein n=1 Tax=Rhamnusium bicolor TaxID=1586634 RepID=A0AAV8XG87_9CUCU|nr:hypothetical protein NQ314_011874 [Rhamnusium bicolor]